MTKVIMLRIDWNRTAIPLPIRGWHTLHINPEPAYPFGRKGLSLAGAWRQLAKPLSSGAILLDGDVAIDPLDQEAMFAAISAQPEAVNTAPARLWEASTHQPGWLWAHGHHVFSQLDTDTPDVFTFCFTYLPRRLIEDCLENGLASWTYPHVDKKVAARARALSIPVNVVRAATPKHLNF